MRQSRTSARPALCLLRGLRISACLAYGIVQGRFGCSYGQCGEEQDFVLGLPDLIGMYYLRTCTAYTQHGQDSLR